MLTCGYDDLERVITICYQRQSVVCSLFQPPDEEPFEAHSLDGEVRLLRAKEAGISGRAEVKALLAFI